MDINDSAGIQTLLEQLKSSQAWQDAVASSPPDISQRDINALPDHPSSVSELLSRLQTEPRQDVETSQKHYLIPPQNNAPNSFAISSPVAINSVQNVSDQRSSTFQQALPLIASQSANPMFIETLKSLKKEQDVLEAKLSEERKAIRSKYEAKVQVAKTKASMIGSGISRHEANMLLDAFEKESKKFDTERVLPAWDGLVFQQREALAQMGVPTMFPTTNVLERENQRKIMQVLEGLI